MHRRPRAIAAAVLAGLIAVPALATTPVVDTFEPAADTSLFGNDPSSSNGAGPDLFAGVTGGQGGFSKLRSPIRFDLSSIPAEATILEASLTVTLTLVNPITQQADPYELRRILAPWGEAGSVSGGGNGAPAQPGDATWSSAFHPDVAWDTPGGDIADTASASLDIGIVDGTQWTFEDPQLAADVQDFVTGAAENHGWMLMGDETLVWTARKFGSREGFSSVRPFLTVTWVIDAGCGGDLDGSGAVDFPDLLAVLGAFGPCDACPEDLDGSGAVDFDDLLAILGAFGGCVGG